jgi:hypoxanthine-guanine phosphoribosyltransferase/biotin operon repressor
MQIATSQKILTYISEKGQASGNELSIFLGISSRAVRKQFASLLLEGKVSKIGRPPKVFYVLSEKISPDQTPDIILDDAEAAKIITQNFLIITPSGEREEGVSGFILWCLKHKLPIEKTAEEYVQTIKKYKAYKKDGLIDGMFKIKATFKEVFVDKLYYLDFYTIERFGKTKLGQFLLYAKQSQNKVLIKELVKQIAPQIKELIETYHIDAVGYIPPTVRREVQLMKEIERQLKLSIPVISIIKIKTEIAVPQKTLTKLEDRIENARKTILVDDNRNYKTVLLIDDALGSGATLNETAKKLKDRKQAEKVIGLAITGSFSGFETINEV